MGTVIIILSSVVILFFVFQLFMIRKMQARRGKEAPQLGGKADELVRHGKVLFYFYSPTCPACKAMTPIVRDLAQRDNRVILEDVSRDIRAAQKFGVMATPTLVVVKNGVIAEILIGRQDESRLRALFAD